MEDDTKLTISRTRENGSTEIIYEILLDNLCSLKKQFPNTYGIYPIHAQEYTLSINISKAGDL